MLLILAAVGLTLGLALWGPVGLSLDSAGRELSLSWYGRPVHRLPWPGQGRKKPAKPKKEKRKAKKKKSRPWLLWAERDLALDLVGRGFRLIGRLIRRIEISRLEGEVSLPDPMVTGLLCAALVPLNRGDNVSLTANFENRNRLLVRASIRPYQIFFELGRFIATLPYYRLLKTAAARLGTRVRPSKGEKS